MRLTLLGALLILTATPFGAAARTLQISDVRHIVDVSDPQISPNGRQIICVVTKPNYDNNTDDSDLLLVDIATGSQRTLTYRRPDVSSPQWSPSGERVAFIARDGDGQDAKDQIFIMPMTGGEARKITDAPSDVSIFAWKPDGSAIAYTTADEPANKAAIKQGHDYFEVRNDPYLTTSAPTSTHVWLISANGGTAQRLTSGSWSLVAPDVSVPLSWSPDGRSIVISRVPTPHSGDGDRSTIEILDVATKQLRKLTTHDRFELYPVFSPDGSKVAYWYPKDGDILNEQKLWVASAAGGRSGVDVTAGLDRNVQRAIWMPDGESLLVGADDATRVSLWIQPLNGAARKLHLGDVNPSWNYWVDVTVGKDGALAFSGAEPKHPTELYYMSAPDAPVRRLTNLNGRTADLDLGDVQTITWQGPDGFTEDGMLQYPPGYVRGKKYPLVLRIHGGPQSASTTEFWDYAQLVAARGYLVFRPNYRGSDNLGNAYMRAIFNDAGNGPGRDVMAGIQAVEKLGIVDTSHVAVGGWSYGGYMTAWMISHYPGWKAAVLGAAYMDGIEDYDLSDSNVSDISYWKGSPWRDDFRRDYVAQSPVYSWKNIATPTLILSNTGDVRVPITQSYAMYHALADNHVPVKFIAWPESGHEVSGPVRIEDLYRIWLDWLDRYLK